MSLQVPRKNRGSIGTAIVKVFDLALLQQGLNERAVLGIRLQTCRCTYVGKDHASYYPGATEIVLKLIFHQLMVKSLVLKLLEKRD